MQMKHTEIICPICHNSTDTPSKVTLQCNYGSVYDGEYICLSICGDCADKLYRDVSLIVGEGKNTRERQSKIVPFECRMKGGVF